MNKLHFELGQLVATAGVADKMEEDSDFKSFVEQSVRRYIHCDWGDTDREDKELNDDAVKNDSRILAAYNKPITGETIWIITEWDRSATTILFPSEY